MQLDYRQLLNFSSRTDLTLALSVVLALGLLTWLLTYSGRGGDLPAVGGPGSVRVSSPDARQEVADAEWQSPRAPAGWNLRVRISRSTDQHVRDLDLLIYALRESSRAAEVAGATSDKDLIHDRFGELLSHQSFRLEDDTTEVLLTVPERQPFVCVAQSALAGDVGPVIVTPIPSKPIRLDGGERGHCEIDLAHSPRVRLALLGEASACASIDVSLPLGMPERLLRSVSIPATDRVTLIGVEGVPLTLWGRGGIAAFPIRLLPDVSERLRFSAGQTDYGLRLRPPVGRLVIHSAGLPQSLYYRLGTRIADLSEYRTDHGLLSLKSLAEAGWTEFYVQARGHAISRVAIVGLKHDANGDVRVDLELGDAATVWVTADGPIAHGDWDLLARPASGEHDGLTVSAVARVWKVAPLSSGAWDFYWTRRKGGLRDYAVALRGHVVEAGTETHVVCPFLEPVTVNLHLRNWQEVPEELRPVAVYVDGFPAKRIADAEGAFTVRLAPSDRWTPHVLLQSPFIGGTVWAAAVEWVGDRLEASIPSGDKTRVFVASRFGGRISVGSFDKSPSWAAPRPIVRRDIKPYTDGSFRFDRGSDIACAVSEDVQDGNEPVFRGFLLVDASQATIDVDLPGRWVDVISGDGGVLIAKATVGNTDAQAFVKTVREGASRLWLPDSVQTLVFVSHRGNQETAANAIGSVLTL